MSRVKRFRLAPAFAAGAFLLFAAFAGARGAETVSTRFGEVKADVPENYAPSDILPGDAYWADGFKASFELIELKETKENPADAVPRDFMRNFELVNRAPADYGPLEGTRLVFRHVENKNEGKVAFVAPYGEKTLVFLGMWKDEENRQLLAGALRGIRGQPASAGAAPPGGGDAADGGEEAAESEKVVIAKAPARARINLKAEIAKYEKKVLTDLLDTTAVRKLNALRAQQDRQRRECLSALVSGLEAYLDGNQPAALQSLKMARRSAWVVAFANNHLVVPVDDLVLKCGGKPKAPKDSAPSADEDAKDDTSNLYCQECGNTGRISCGECFGLGRVRCPRCRGTGQARVQAGTSYRSRRSSGLSSYGSRSRTYQNPDLSKSGGEGVSNVRKRNFKLVTCPTCQGTGSVGCSRCKGSGWLPCPVCEKREALEELKKTFTAAQAALGAASGSSSSAAPGTTGGLPAPAQQTAGSAAAGIGAREEEALRKTIEMAVYLRSGGMDLVTRKGLAPAPKISIAGTP